MHDLVAVVPSAIRLNRGKKSFDNICKLAYTNQASSLLILERWEGRVGTMQFYKRSDESYDSIDSTFYIKSCRLRREFHINNKPNRSVNRRLAVISDADIVSGKASNLFALFLGVQKISTNETGKYSILLSLERRYEDTFAARFLSLPAMIEVGPSLILHHKETVAGVS